MIEAFSTDAADQAFNARILPWRSWRRDNFFDARVLDALTEVRSVDAVAVSDQEARHFVIRKGIDDLLGRPARTWIRRDVEVDDHAAVVSEYDEAEQYTKRRCRNGEEVNRHDIANVVVKERTPRL